MTGPTEVVLRSETLEASFLPELGARIHRLRAFGHDLLRTPDDLAAHRADPFFWGAYPMAPWCNRASVRRTTVAGRTVELQPNFPDGTAIHGLASAVPWERAGDGSFELVHRADDAWPWTFSVRLVALLRDADLTLRWTLANLDDAPMPAGLGLHPWFRRPVELRMLASAVYASNVSSTAEPQPVEGATDLRSLATPAGGLDGTWTALEEPAIELAWPPLGVRGSLEARSSAGRTLVALATPADVEAIALEPQTHGPNPLRRLAAGEPDAPVLLDPGSELELELRLQFGLARGDHA